MVTIREVVPGRYLGGQTVQREPAIPRFWHDPDARLWRSFALLGCWRLTFWKHVECILIISVIVLRLHLDADSALEPLELQHFITLYPGGDDATHPSLELIPPVCDLFSIEALDTTLECVFEAAKIDAGCRKSFDEIRSGKHHLALHGASDVAKNPAGLLLASIRRKTRRRWDSWQWRETRDVGGRIFLAHAPEA